MGLSSCQPRPDSYDGWMKGLLRWRTALIPALTAILFGGADAWGSWRFHNAIGRDRTVAVYKIRVDGQLRYVPIFGFEGEPELPSAEKIVRQTDYCVDFVELLQQARRHMDEGGFLFFAGTPLLKDEGLAWRMIDGHFVVFEPLSSEEWRLFLRESSSRRGPRPISAIE